MSVRDYPDIQPQPQVIDLTKGRQAIVDDTDYYDLSKHKWYASPSRNTYYARRDIYRNGTKKTIYMHAAILGAKKGCVTDHINGNGLDNRRSNLRFATNSQSAVNQKNRSDNTSGQRGIHWHKGSGKWQARIRVNQKYICLGSFHRLDEATKVYEDAANLYFGEYRR